MTALKIERISKRFTTNEGTKEILHGIDFSLNRGEIVGIRGENGSGKTTLFNIIAGIEQASTGTISIGEYQNRNLKLGVVFQNYNSTLLPWLSVKDNVCIPLKITGLQQSEQDRKLKDVLERLMFEKLPLKNYPHQLSGGQKQRVAIARALIQEPDILILDEPFSNLDYQTSLELQDIIQQIHSFKNIAILVVSHNIDHVLYLADRVLILAGHPSTIEKEFTIELPRPRKKDILVSKQFEELRNRILEFEYAAFQNDKV